MTTSNENASLHNQNLSKAIPKLRFKGFYDEWQSEKLDQFVTLLNGRAYKQKELLKKGKYIVLRVGNFNTNNQLYYSDLELDNKYYAYNGDLLYTWSTILGPHIWNGPKVIYHYHIWKLNLKNNVNKFFVLQLLEKDKNKMLLNTHGTTMTHITKVDMENKIFQIPSLAEQEKIGSFFKRIDQLIALHEQKLALLKQKRQGYLQKLFPQKDAKIPRLRFKGFNDVWKEKKLREVGIIKSGNAFSEKEQGGLKGTPFYKVSDMNILGNNVYMKKANNYVTNCQIKLNKYNVIQEPSIIFAKVGAAIFLERKRIAKNFIIDNNMMFFTPFKLLDIKFSLYIFNNIKLSRYVQIGSLPSYNATDLSLIKILIPNIQEQKEISSLLTKFDKLIELQEHKLELLKQKKQAYLQKMFI